MIKSPKSLSDSATSSFLVKILSSLVLEKGAIQRRVLSYFRALSIVSFALASLCSKAYSNSDDLSLKTSNFEITRDNYEVDKLLLPPSNDNCNGAIALAVNTATSCTIFTTGTTVDATQSLAGCTAIADDDVWYKFVATQASQTVTVTPLTMQNPVFQVFAGNCAGLSSLICRNNTSANTGAESYTLTGLNNGDTYFVRVYSAANSTGKGTFTICITSPAVSYCSPSTTSASSTAYISNVSFLGTLNDVANTNSSYNANGFQDFTALTTKSRQAQGEGMNVYVQANTLSRIKAWVDWNKDGDFVDAGEKIYDSRIGIVSTTFGYVIPTTASPGEYRMRVRNYMENAILAGENYALDFSPCENFGPILIGVLSTRYGEAEDYSFNVTARCSAVITSVTDGITCGNGSATLVATGSSGATEYRWYSALTDGTLLATTTTGTWNTPVITATTTYYVTAFNGCESVVRTPITAEKNAVPSIEFTPPTPVLCGENDIISLAANGDIEVIDIINEHFENGLGLFTNVALTNNGATVNSQTAWQSRASTFIPVGEVWFPAISAGFGANKFIMSTSDIGVYTTHNALVSPTVSSVGLLDLTLTFKMYYSHYLADGVGASDDFVAVEISTDNGANWTEVRRYTSDIGIGTRFEEETLNLNGYINNANLRIRVRYYGVFRDGVAIDNFKLFGNKQLNAIFQFASNTPIAAFTDIAGTIPYNAQGNTATVIYIKPTLAQLENANFTITASAVLSNGCTATKNVKIDNKTKILSGTVANWNTASNWKPSGIPNADNCVVIAGSTIISGTAYEAYGKTLSVKQTGRLTINSRNTLTVTDAVKVASGGNFEMQNTSSLVQINNVANSGNIKTTFITKPMRRYDYTYWSAPSSPQLLKNVSPSTLADKYFSWNTAAQNWQLHAEGNVEMVPARGYIVRAPQSFSTTAATTHSTTLEGVPHNGTISTNVEGNNSTIEANYKWNLIGNPYPSAIDARLFLQHLGNTAAVDGTIYLWTHNSLPSALISGQGVINYTPYDYATFNLTGGVGVSAVPDPSNPEQSNNFNSTIPSGYIASGQSFFIKGLSNSAVQFTNAMRVKGNNSEFFRTVPIEKDRFWLNMSDDQSAFSQILIGYIDRATEGLDRGYDGELFGYTNIALYSIIEEKQLTIQARSFPLNSQDIVQIGYRAEKPSSLEISIGNLEGIFAGQNIFVVDKLLHSLHNLKESKYRFTTEAGIFNDRFEIIYNENVLEVKDLAPPSNAIVVYKKDKKIIIKTEDIRIESVNVYDLQGRLLYDENHTASLTHVIDYLPTVNQVLIIKIVLQNGVTKNVKIQN